MAEVLKYSTSYNNLASALYKNIVISLIILCSNINGNLALSQAIPEYDEVNLFLDVKGIGGAEIASLVKGEDTYLSVSDLFSYLKIKNTISPALDSISGFFINPEDTYLIDRNSHSIHYRGKAFLIQPGDLIRTTSALYLKAGYFGEVFGLDCRFSFRNLSVSLVTDLELPAIKEMRQELMRQNIQNLRGERPADTLIPRRYPGFHFGMADWSLISTQQPGEKTETRATLSLGSVIAGGEANVTLNYSTIQPFRERDQQYLWRFVDNEFRPLRQFAIGKIDAQSTSTIYDPVVGVQLTNTPSSFRRAFGTYTLADHTEPGWIVELYVNNVLVDYTKADPSGFFTFEVPLVYGNTDVKLRYYGPWGEERSKEQNISIPFNFLPHKEFEYTLSGGMVEDKLHSIYSRGDIHYGLSKRITLGAGVEYLSSVTSGNTMPFANISMRMARNLLLSGEYTYGVRARGILSYRLPSDLQFEAYYTWYDRNQSAINFNYREQRKFIVSFPFRGNRTMIYSRLTVDQIIMPESKYTTTELMFSGSVLGVITNFSTYALFTGPDNPYVYSRLSLGIRLPARFVFTPQAQFEYNDARFVSMKLELEKHLFAHGYLNLAYEQGFRSGYRSIQLSMRYDLPFAQTTLTARQSSLATTFIESARGSLMLDAATDYAGATNRVSVGKGGIVILPFLDLDGDGINDPDEPRAAGLSLRVNGGRVRYNNKDTSIRILDLEPYTHYLVELNQNSFENISWQLKIKSLSIAVDPNSFKKVEIPVSVYGEVAGMVYLENNRGKAGQGRIIVNIYDEEDVPVARILSEPDGFFSFMGLRPGNYFMRVDSLQLSKLNMVADPAVASFTIKRSISGDYFDGIDFLLHHSNQETGSVSVENGAAKITTGIPGNGAVQNFAVQAGAFSSLSNAEALKNRISQMMDIKVSIIEEDSFYKVLIEGFGKEEDTNRFIGQLKKNGIEGAFLYKK